MCERPPQQRVVLSWQYLDVDRDVCSVPRPVTVQEQRRLKPIAVLTRVERRTDQLDAVFRLGLGQLGGVVADLPYESARVVEREARHGVLEARYLVLLLCDEAAHERQVLLCAFVDVLLKCETITL